MLRPLLHLLPAFLVACGDPPPPAAAGPSTLAPSPEPDLPCPFDAGNRWIVGGVPVPGPAAVAPTEDHLTVGDRPTFVPGRIAEVTEDGGVVWVAARGAGVHRVSGGVETPFPTRSPAIAIDARDGVAWAATVDGEVLRIADGQVTRFAVDGVPDAIVATGQGAWVHDLGDVWRPVANPSVRPVRDAPAPADPDPVVALYDGVVATASGVQAIGRRRAAVPGVIDLLPAGDAWLAVTAKDGVWRVADGVATQIDTPEPVEILATTLDTEPLRLTADGELVPTGRAVPRVGGGWFPARAMATRAGWVAIGYGLMGRLTLLGPAGESRVVALPGPVEAIGAPIAGSRLRWDDDGLWIPMPAHGLARLASPASSLVLLAGVPGAWDVAPLDDTPGDRVVALGDLGVGVLRGDTLVGRCALPGRVVRVATGPGGVWAASTGVVTRLDRKPPASGAPEPRR